MVAVEQHSPLVVSVTVKEHKNKAHRYNECVNVGVVPEPTSILNQFAVVVD